MAVEERGKKAKLQYRADCISRRLCILYGERIKVTLNGITSSRAYPRPCLVRPGSVSGIENYLT